MTLQDLIRYAVGGLVALVVLLFLAAIRSFRQSRSNPYWHVRRSAGERGWRLLALMLGAIFGVVVLVVIGGPLLAFLDETIAGETPAAPIGYDPTPEDAAVVSGTPTLTPTDAATPTPFTYTPTPSSTPTDTPPPSDTPEPTFTPTRFIDALPTLEGAVSAPETARILISQLDDEISPDGGPLSAQDQFSSTIDRLYVFINYYGMVEGVEWSRLLLRDGEIVQGGRYRWVSAESGAGYYFFGLQDGLEPGTYEIAVYVGDRLSDQVSFTVTE